MTLANESKNLAEWRPDGVAWLDRLIRDALNSAVLTHNEFGFLADLSKRLTAHQERLSVSARQWKWLLAIERKLLGATEEQRRPYAIKPEGKRKRAHG